MGLIFGQYVAGRKEILVGSPIDDMEPVVFSREQMRCFIDRDGLKVRNEFS